MLCKEFLHSNAAFDAFANHIFSTASNQKDFNNFDQNQIKRKYLPSRYEKYFVIGFIGTPRPHKGLEDLISALDLLKYNDFLLHINNNQGRIVVRDIETAEPIKSTGKPGILELVTPYGVESYAGVAVLLDDIVQVENWERCPECGREGAIFRVLGRLTPSIGKGCSSLITLDAYKL